MYTHTTCSCPFLGSIQVCTWLFFFFLTRTMVRRVWVPILPESGLPPLESAFLPVEVIQVGPRIRSAMEGSWCHMRMRHHGLCDRQPSKFQTQALTDSIKLSQLNYFFQSFSCLIFYPTFGSLCPFLPPSILLSSFETPAPKSLKSHFNSVKIHITATYLYPACSTCRPPIMEAVSLRQQVIPKNIF